VPVKRILAGANVEAAVARDALANPDSLGPFVERAGQG
jgi:acetoacetyl-CoA synthetase